APSYVYSLSLHDALPILTGWPAIWAPGLRQVAPVPRLETSNVNDFVLSSPFHTARPSPLFRPRLSLCCACKYRVAMYGLARIVRSEEHTSELQSPDHLVC